jgi:hypothetical protein
MRPVEVVGLAWRKSSAVHRLGQLRDASHFLAYRRTAS